MAPRIKLKDSALEKRLFNRRVIVVGLLILGGFVAIVMRLAFLQIQSHEHFVTLSQENRIRLRPIAPPRGLIYDRNGVLLADNLPSFRLDVFPENVPNLNDTLTKLGRLIEIKPSDISRFQAQKKQNRIFDAIPLRYQLTEQEIAIFSASRHHFPGVEIQASLNRFYPHRELLAHVIGYTGALDEKDIKRVDEGNYLGTTHIGKGGVESFYEDILHGQVGHEEVEINAQGRSLRVLESVPPKAGNNLYLGIDARLQKVAMDAMGEHQGALVAIEVNSGEVLAMVSMPSYDPNPFVHGIDVKSYQALNTDKHHPMLNRALYGQYPPGSTIKPFMGLADLESSLPLGKDGIFCPGFYQLEGSGFRFRDWRRGGHGTVNLHRAIVESCDVYFYQLSMKLGIDRMHEYLSKFGFGVRTGIDMPKERRGVLPNPEWKKRVYKQNWYIGETINASIGQGYTLVTPLQLAQATAIMARNGKIIAPRLVKTTYDPGKNTHESKTPFDVGEVTVANPDNWKKVIAAMHDVVQGQGGTARAASAGAPYQFAGKTGTAQVFTLGRDEKYNEKELARELQDHALFIAFAPLDRPKIAVAIIVEHGGHGGSVAAPIVRKVIDAYLLEGDHDIPRKLP